MFRVLLFLLLTALFTACIGDDVVDDYVQPELRLLGLVDTLEVGTTHQLAVNFFNNVGQMENIRPTWTSSDDQVLSVDGAGLVTAHEVGSAMVTASYEDEFGEQSTAEHYLSVGESTVVTETSERRHGQVETTSSYPLTGAFTLEVVDETDLVLAFGEDYLADTSLPGLYVYLSNNPRSTEGALEIGAVQVFNGAHEYRIQATGIDDYAYVLYFCKPFNIKVGDGEILEE
ncbi:Ig-like domain-containing protein [Lewinella sp. W8]|uniref:Ig-like domain-containing protein n=1 Tax=Lewinella sp. W8 TaxID=2528208 RepID=UPI001068AAA8|nr:Ig-like domain-containing protein [Lewinella sp. W8]MTB53104.1 hypothetical protein [Lewinella sp. W8]